MDAHQKPANLIKAELLIAHVLRYGVLLCLFVVGIGLSLRLSGDHTSREIIRTLVSGLTPGDYHPPADFVSMFYGVTHFQPDTVIALGVVMLIALPILRVALTTLIFFHERDWPFFAITLVVLTVLLTGVILGRAL